MYYTIRGMFLDTSFPGREKRGFVRVRIPVQVLSSIRTNGTEKKTTNERIFSIITTRVGPFAYYIVYYPIVEKDC